MGFGMVVLIGVYMLLSAGGLVLFKLGSSKGLNMRVADGTFDAKIHLLVFVGLVCYIISFSMYMFLVSKFDLSYIVPLTTGIIYILTLVASVTIFKEILKVHHIIGVGFILLGVFLINLKR